MNESLLKEGTLCRISTFLSEVLRQISFLKKLRNIQRDYKEKSGLLNVIKEEKINLESYSFFVDVKLLHARILDNKLVLCYSSPLPCQSPKSNLHHLRKMSAEKHNDCANSEIGYGRQVLSNMKIIMTKYFKPKR